MERQVSTITPADTGTMMLPGAAAGALGFTAANIGKQLLASKFKGYGHLATSSLASAGFGALVGGLGGSFINKKPRSTPIQASYNNEMNNNNYIDKQSVVSLPVATRLKKEAGIKTNLRRYYDLVSGKSYNRAKTRFATAELFRNANLDDVTMLSSRLKERYGEAANLLDPGFKFDTAQLNASMKHADTWSHLADKFQNIET